MNKSILLRHTQKTDNISRVHYFWFSKLSQSQLKSFCRNNATNYRRLRLNSLAVVTTETPLNNVTLQLRIRHFAKKSERYVMQEKKTPIYSLY